jgi:hypothetical protein
MKLIDSNIIIYSAYVGHAYLRPLVMDPANYVSEVSRVRSIGPPSIERD